MKNDLLTYIYFDDSIDHYVLQKEHKLIDLQKKVEVIKIGGSSTKFVTVDKFLTHKGMIFTVPSTLYTINGSRVSFKDQEINDLIEGQKGLNNCDAESDNEESNANEEDNGFCCRKS